MCINCLISSRSFVLSSSRPPPPFLPFSYAPYYYLVFFPSFFITSFCSSFLFPFFCTSCIHFFLSSFLTYFLFSARPFLPFFLVSFLPSFTSTWHRRSDFLSQLHTHLFPQSHHHQSVRLLPLVSASSLPIPSSPTSGPTSSNDSVCQTEKSITTVANVFRVSGKSLRFTGAIVNFSIVLPNPPTRATNRYNICNTTNNNHNNSKYSNESNY